MEDFEGPLDLILFLLSKNKIEIQDIPIALILDQYLEYLEKRQQMDLEVASEFVNYGFPSYVHQNTDASVYRGRGGPE